MDSQQDRQLLQIKNIIETMLEASEHLKLLLKSENINNAIFMFSSLVQGYESIEKFLEISGISKGLDTRKRIEQTILQCAKQLEKGNPIKIIELLQFSLIPNLKKLQSYFKQEDIKKEMYIGVYLDQQSPRKVLPEARTFALVNEAKKQGANLYFFSSEDVNFEKRKIYGETYIDGQWKKTDLSFPDVINNVGMSPKSRQSSVERKLRREIPFTSYAIGNKFFLAKKLVESGQFANLLVPFRVATDLNIILEFLSENKKAVIKPVRGARGERIYYVEKNGNHYSLFIHTKKKKLDKGSFENWINDVILKKKGSYMVQHYVHSRTKYDEPFDIRAHVQKNGEGTWQITKIYPRIGNKKSILSNISRGGRTDDIDSFIVSEYGDEGSQIINKLEKLSLEIAWHIDKLHGLALDELGLDLAIDKNGNYWLHEANIGPQSTYHEKERAVNTIAYALYLAKNGIFHTNEFEQIKLPKNQFNSKNSEIDIVELEYDITIGMLVDEKEINELTIACAYVANYEKVNFYYFSPKDIDFEEGLIRGYFYINNEWVPKIVKYPDVIYDRLRLRGIKGYDYIYEEFEDIPMTNEFFGNSISKLEVYDKLKETGKLEAIIIPYRKVKRVKDIMNYLDKYGSIIIKPEIGSFAKGVHLIEKLKIDEYKMAVNDEVKIYNMWELRSYLQKIIKSGTFIVQKYIESRSKDGQPFDIRAHMMKDGQGNWSIVTIYPRIGVNYATISAIQKGGYRGELVGFLKRNFTESDSFLVMENIKDLAKKVAFLFEGLYNTNMNELGLDFVLDKNLNIYLLEVNVNKPGITNYEFKVAIHAIQYSKYLAKEELNR